MTYVEKYSDVIKTKPGNTRRKARKTVLSLLNLLEKHKNNDETTQKPRVQFLLMHHVFDDEIKHFENAVQTLSDSYTFVSYSEAVEIILKRNIDKPYLTFSFDDGFKNNLIAARILKEFNAQSCFFINPGIIGEKNYHKIKVHNQERLMYPPVEQLTWVEVEKIQELGHEIGSHTMKHINIGVEPAEIIEHEIFESYRVINEKCGPTKHFAFPYGTFSNFNDFSRKTVFAAGYYSCASAMRGCHINHDCELKKEEFCIRRDDILLFDDNKYINYFLLNSSKKAHCRNNLFPYGKD